MTTEVLQAFASEYNRLLFARDALNGTRYAEIPIRPVLGRITQQEPSAIGMYVDDNVTDGHYGGGGSVMGNIHFVIGSRSQATAQALQAEAQVFDRYSASLPIYTIGRGGALAEDSSRLLRVFGSYIVSQIPDVTDDGVHTIDLTLRVNYAVEAAQGG